MENIIRKPSRLIKVAINDISAVESMPKWSIDMNYWFSDKCTVCLAGAVMLCTYKCKSWHDFREKIEFDLRLKVMVDALDSFRQSDYNEFLSAFIENKELLTEVTHSIYSKFGDITQYNKSPEDFKTECLEIANYLQSIGL